jgi:hypothetical protein
MNGSELIEEEPDLSKSHTPSNREPGADKNFSAALAVFNIPKRDY